MKKSRYSEEQIIGILKQSEAGVKTPDLCREHGISAATFCDWKQKFGGMDVSEAQQLKAMEDENRSLKLLVAELRLFLPATCAGHWLRTKGHYLIGDAQEFPSDHDVGQSTDQPGTLPAPFPTDQQALPRGLVDQIQQSYCSSIMCPCTHEVIAPHVVGVRRPEPDAEFIVSHSLLRGFWGTFSPSRRQIRSTRSLPTCQPARFSSAVMRRFP